MPNFKTFSARPDTTINLDMVQKFVITHYEKNYYDDGELYDEDTNKKDAHWELIIYYPGSSTDFRPNHAGVYMDVIVPNYDVFEITLEEKLFLDIFLEKEASISEEAKCQK